MAKKCGNMWKNTDNKDSILYQNGDFQQTYKITEINPTKVKPATKVDTISTFLFTKIKIKQTVNCFFKKKKSKNKNKG